MDGLPGAVGRISNPSASPGRIGNPSYRTRPSKMNRPLDGHDVLLDGVLDQLGAGRDPESLHHAVLVEGDGPRGDVQDAGDLLHRAPLGQQLQHLALAWAQLAGL